MHYEINIDPDVFLPCYRHLQDDQDVDVDFIYGSRDSGKSRDTAQRLVIKCLTAPYFRYILARKTFNTIQDSQWQLIKDVVNEWNLDSLFTFRKSPLGIDCVNGNRFIARGFDDPAQIKSTQNPSGAWCEEGSQLTKEDWVTLITSLRSNEGRIKIDVTFNPEADGDYRDFWLYKDHFSHTTDLSFIQKKAIKAGDKEHVLTYRATHTTYHDNPFCPPQRKAEYEDLKITSPYHYRIYGLGLWGNRENKSPFVLTFDRQKHLGPTSLNSERPLYLSFDFNRNPMCCNVIQWDGERKVDFLEIIKLPNSTIYTMCDQIKVRYPGQLYIVCGDGSGSARSAMVRDVDLNSYYKVIQQELELSSNQLQYVVNPPIERNQVLINWCFQHLDITINPDTCQPLIFDLEFAEMMANGQLKKSDREDPAQQLDSLDGCRYFFSRYFSKLNPLN